MHPLPVPLRWCAALLVLAVGLGSQNPWQPPVAAARLNGKWGFIDPSGNWVVQNRFDHADVYSQGLARVRLMQRWAFIDRWGRISVDPYFSAALPFTENLAPARSLDGKWGMITRQGKWAIAAQYDSLKCLRNNRARFSTYGRWGFISGTGRQVVAPNFVLAYGFSRGLAPVKTGTRWVYIDTLGFFRENEFAYALPFRARHAVARTDSLAGLIQHSNTAWALQPRWDWIETSDEGWLTLMYQGSYSIFDSSLAEHRDLGRLDWVGRFSEGLAPFRASGKYGFLTPEGKKQIPAAFDRVGPFRHGLAFAEKEGLFGFITPAGEWQILPRFEAVHSFHLSTSAAVPDILPHELFY